MKVNDLLECTDFLETFYVFFKDIEGKEITDNYNDYDDNYEEMLEKLKNEEVVKTECVGCKCYITLKVYWIGE